MAGPFFCTKFFAHPPHFTPNFSDLLCMHKKRTKYRFKLWYKLQNI
jgi:hypothetical protein